MIASFLATLVTGTMPTFMVRIEGDGFLRFAKGTQILYARQAKLTATAQGLTAADGSMLIPRLIAPAGTTKIDVSIDGTLTAELPGGSKQMGRLVIAVFDTKTGFNHVGNYVTTTAKPTLTNPGEWVAGVIRTTPLVATKTAAKPGATLPKVEAENFYTPKAEVIVNVSSEIEGDEILLGSIAKIEGDADLKEKLNAVDFGRAPIYGSKRGLTLLHVRANILAAKIDMRNVKVTVPEGAYVMRKSQKVEPTSIDDVVAAAVKTKFGFETKVTQKTRINPIIVPLGAITLDVSQLNLNNSDISGIVDIAVDGKLANSVRISYEMPTLSMVKRGDPVRLRMVSNFAKVEVSAKATSNGYLGQTVSVETDNKTTLTGTLIGPGLVEVKL